MSTAERLSPVLAWLNTEMDIYAAAPRDEKRWTAEGRRTLLRFVASFDGSPESGFLEVSSGRKAPGYVRALTRRPPLDPDALQTIQIELRLVLEGGSGTMPLQSLAFGTRPARSTQKLTGLTTRQRRAYEGPGAFVLRVSGSLHDLVIYGVLHLLRAPGMVTIRRCPAPAPYHPSETCGRFLVGAGQGRPREFCSDRCRVRRHEQQRQASNKTRRRSR